MSRSRAYCLTVNNFCAKDIEQLRSLKYKYLVFAHEVGEQGTPHLQGYVCLSSAMTKRALSKKIPRAHLEVAKGSALQNYAYCRKIRPEDSKPNEVWEQHGTMPSQGKRTDIDKVKNLVKDGKSLKEIAEECSSYQSLKFAQLYRQIHQTPRDFETQVIWIYGPTGTGKSKWVTDNYPEAKWISKQDCFFLNYDGSEEVVVIDDFRKDFCKFHELLRLTDRYPLTVPIKGGEVQWKPKVLIITTPYHPKDTYNTREDIGQLERRINQLIHLEKIQ